MRVLVVLALLGCGCGTEPELGYSDPTDDPQTPPRGNADLRAWLDKSYFVNWQCEPMLRPAHEGSPHDYARVCSNELLATSDPSAAALPIGVASVKEIYGEDGAMLIGRAVSRKVTSEDDDGWYWFEHIGKRVLADGMNTGSCPDCHRTAVSENTFVIVR